MNKLIFLSAQPLDLKFLWEVEVQIVNFRKFGISDKMHIVVWYMRREKDALQGWYNLQEKYPEVNIFYYEDRGVNRNLYVPQLRPHALKYHFKKYEQEFKDKVFFYHDSDILFNYLPNFESLLKDDVCWQSNTSGYLDYNYIKRVQERGNIPNNEAMNLLCNLGGITEDIFKSYAGKTGGAQTMLKGVDYNFWSDVERISILIRQFFYYGSPNSINKRYFKNTYDDEGKLLLTAEDNGFQSWCADMWALNFALWKRGIKTDVTDDLAFSWATDSYSKFLEKPIYHNAGACKNNDGIFYKGDYIHSSPIGKKITVNPNSASAFYVQSIREVSSL